MPIDGLPDPDRHKLCCRCKKWHEPDEGTMFQAGSGPKIAILQAGRLLSGYRNSPCFMCFRCQKVRRWTQIVLFGTALLLVALALILERLGVLGK